MIGNQYQITAQQLLCLVVQRQTHPVGKKADRADRSDGNHQRRQQQAQFAGAQLAPEQAPGQDYHGRACQVAWNSSAATALP